MNIYFILDRDLFSEDYLDSISKYGNILFMSKLNEENYSVLKEDDKDKVIVYDPDYAGWSFPKNIISDVIGLKAIFLGTTDKSYVDLELCDSRGVDVINIPRYASSSVAEYLVMYMFSLAKKIPLQIKNQNVQIFSDRYMQVELNKKKVGIVGLGNIGTKVAKICDGLGMNVSYWNRTKKENNWTYIPLNQLFKECDVIFICLAISGETKTLITDELLNNMKKSCILISGTGKQLFNSELVINKIKNNELFGFALEEPNTSLDKYDGNIMVTSEYGWFTKEASELRIRRWYELIIDYLLKN